jgi:ABC-type amino acid transport substrate-binding protein
LDSAGIPPKNRLSVYDIDNAFKMLNHGRGDIVIVSPSTGKASLEKLGLSDGSIKILYPPVITINLYPYMNRKHSILAKKLADKIKEMKETGQYDEIIRSIKE